MHCVVLDENFSMMGYSLSSNNVKLGLSKIGLSEYAEKTRFF